MSRSQDFENDDEFPVLIDVVKKGDAKLIEAARRINTEAGVTVSPIFDHPPAEISRSITTPGSARHNPSAYTALGDSRFALSEKQLEQLVDDIISRHTEQMRNELFSILKNRR